MNPRGTEEDDEPAGNGGGGGWDPRDTMPPQGEQEPSYDDWQQPPARAAAQRPPPAPQAPPAPRAPQLPPGWKATKDSKTGRTYYWHKATRAVSWKFPTEEK